MSFLRNFTNNTLLYFVVPLLFLCGFILIADQQKSKLDIAANYILKEISESVSSAQSYTGIHIIDFRDVSADGKTPGISLDDSETELTPASHVRDLELGETLKADEVQKIVAEDTDINRVPLEFANKAVSTEDVLQDKLNLVTQDFKIPTGLKERVGFWFDIYTKYSSHFVVIHDSDRPWIIYRVVDLREIYSRPVNRFVKDNIDRHVVAKAKAEVHAILNSLGRGQDSNLLTGEKLRIAKLFDNIKGNKKHLFAVAARNVREQRGQKDFYRKGIIYSSRYLNEMEEIFAQYDLPVELVRLPLVESSFNEAAQSKVGASGIWQFMRGTGKKFLKVGSLVDERNSPIKATEAAAKLMLSNFRVLKTWPLAVTAYNHGAGGLHKASKKLKTMDLTDIIANFKTKSFSFASQNFYCEFLAALYGEKYQEDVFGSLAKYPPLPGETLSLHHKIRAKTLVDIVGITMEELKLFNPDLRRQVIAGFTFLPAGYHVRLPPGRKARLELYYRG